MVRGRQRLRALRLIPTPPTRPPAHHHHAAAAATTAATTTTTTALADAGVGWLAGDCDLCERTSTTVSSRSPATV